MSNQVRSDQMDSKVDQLHSQAKSLAAKFEQGGGTNYIDEAIVLDREALALCPLGHPKRYLALDLLGGHLSGRYTQLGAMTDLEEAILLGRDTLAICTAGHLDRFMGLGNLAFRLSIRYEQLGAIDDLNEAIALGRDTLVLFPLGHPDRSRSLSNLSTALSTRYTQLGAMEDLNEAIVLARDALELCPLGSPNSASTGSPHSLTSKVKSPASRGSRRNSGRTNGCTLHVMVSQTETSRSNPRSRSTTDGSRSNGSFGVS